MNGFNYTTQEGDRLDLLAHRFYGGMSGIRILVEANPFVPIEAVIPVGTVMVVPFFDDTQIIENENLPPWKQHTP